VTRDPAEVIVTRLLSEKRVVICAQCETADANTTDGRRRHQQLHGHALSGTDTRKKATRA
jgi:hypothetical protein